MAHAGPDAMDAGRAGAVFRERARAKINLSLRVTGRRADGYHTLESLVAFADLGDTLTLMPSDTLSVAVTGPCADALRGAADNLVLKAAHAFAAQVPGARAGQFTLDKHLPVASGIGGGSADAAAALRLMARLNAIADDDARVIAAARATGADVPVCLASRAMMMRGIGEVLSPVPLPPLDAVLVNPGVAVATRDVFAALNLASDSERPIAGSSLGPAAGAERAALAAFLRDHGNDLEAPARMMAPVIATVLAALARTQGQWLVRMSGSGATCFALYDTPAAAQTAAAALASSHPAWWVRATQLGRTDQEVAER